MRANVFRNEWGRNHEFWNSGRLLTDRNIITRARHSAGSADSRAKNLYDDSIFRRSLVFGNLHTPLNTGRHIWSGARATIPLYRGPFVAINSRFYHNTITVTPCVRACRCWQTAFASRREETVTPQAIARALTPPLECEWHLGDGTLA